MPKPETKLVIDFSSLLGPLFFMWLLQLLLPVSLRYFSRPISHNFLVNVRLTSCHNFHTAGKRAVSDLREGKAPEDDDEDAGSGRSSFLSC